MNANMENLIKAEQTANLLVGDLKAAYAKSEPLVEIALRTILEKAVAVEKALKALNKAKREPNKTTVRHTTFLLP